MRTDETSWIALITHLPTENATVRMRAWRALKASGAAVLRDGVYLLPDQQACRGVLTTVAEDVRTGGGRTLLVRLEPLDGADFVRLFDRSEHFKLLEAEIAKTQAALKPGNADDTVKLSRKLRKTLAGIVQIDFFPGEAQRQAAHALQALEHEAARATAPGEPGEIERQIERLNIADYRGRTWATRRRPWVDRLACAWLIRRFIDPGARIVWLESPADCPPDALGFDFDSARFTHVGVRVSFEVMLASFGLEQRALQRLGALIHFLDVGGIQPLEAAGVESVLAGLRDAIADDDELLAQAERVFDGLLKSFEKAER